MIDAHITDGDFVRDPAAETARNGDIVVAQVEENAVTLKRFFKEKDRIRLQPANPAYPAQFYADVRIQGQADRRHPPAGLIRRLSTGVSTAGHTLPDYVDRDSTLSSTSLTVATSAEPDHGDPPAEGVRPRD